VKFRGLSIALVAALLAAGAPAEAKQRKVLVYCSEGSPENFSPPINTTGTSFDAVRPLYSNLTEFERGTTNLVPGLAERWEVSPDGLSYTFHLRRGVKWHANRDFTPTRDFNADDVLFSLMRQWDKKHPYHPVSGGDYSYFNSMGMPDLLAGVEKLDDHTVRIRLTHPEAPFLANLAMDWAGIMSAEYADFLMKRGTPERFDQDPIGTGPFRLQRYQKDAVVRYVPFEQWYGGRQQVDALVFAITPDAAVRYAKLKAGECDVMAYPNPADLPLMRRDKDLQLLSQEGLNIGYVTMNVGRKPFDDRRVRQAVNHAIDKARVVENIFQGSGTPAVNPIPPTLWSYNRAVRDYEYDPEKAKRLLAEAGFPEGFETDLWAMPVQRPHNPNARRMAEMIQADLAKVGIRVRIVSFEWGEYRKRVYAGEHGMAIFGWTGDNGDPDNFFYNLLGCDSARPGGSNLSKWCHKPFNDLVVQAKRTTDQAERARLYEQAQLIFKEEAPWVTMAHSVVFQPLLPHVQGYRQSPLGRNEFDGVSLRIEE